MQRQDRHNFTLCDGEAKRQGLSQVEQAAPWLQLLPHHSEISRRQSGTRMNPPRTL